MEFGKTVSNPMLVGTIELLKADPSDDHKKMFVTEMMQARFMSPVLITPMPERDENGRLKLTPENKVQFPMLTAPDGKNFFMAFTDMMEFKKWKDEEGVPFFALTMEEFCAMTLRKESVSMGAVINPFGGNIVVGREMMASLISAKLKHMQAAQAANASDDKKKA